MLNIVIAGATGRMGRALMETILADTEVKLSAALEQSNSPALGQDAGAMVGMPCGVRICADVTTALADADVLVDFTRPESSLAYLAACRHAGVAMVIGTTGFSTEQKQTIVAAARDIPIVFAPNMSMGVNLLIHLVEVAAKVLGQDYDVEIIEAHHRYKVDAPSGTALRLGEVAARALGRDLAECAVYSRKGIEAERNPSAIGFATVRGGDIVGDHTVLFAGLGERLELTHKASSRATFAQGAVRAAKWLAGKQPGLYDMQQVLGL